MFAAEKKEGAEQKCDKCGTPLICVKITKEWNGKSETKLQWQVKGTGKPHFQFAGDKKYKCINIPEKNEDTAASSSVKDDVNDDYLKKKQSELLACKSKLSAEQTDAINAEIDLLQAIEKLVTGKLSVGNSEVNPQKVGMYIKLVRDRIKN